MSDKKYVVPEAAITAVRRAIISSNLRCFEEIACRACEAFAKWIAEDMVVSQALLDKLRHAWDSGDYKEMRGAEYNSYMANGLLRGMFLAPVEKYPKELKKLLLSHKPEDRGAIVKAFELGKRESKA
jgi:hypothetical protein